MKAFLGFAILFVVSFLSVFLGEFAFSKVLGKERFRKGDAALTAIIASFLLTFVISLGTALSMLFWNAIPHAEEPYSLDRIEYVYSIDQTNSEYLKWTNEPNGSMINDKLKYCFVQDAESENQQHDFLVQEFEIAAQNSGGSDYDSWDEDVSVPDGAIGWVNVYRQGANAEEEKKCFHIIADLNEMRLQEIFSAY